MSDAPCELESFFEDRVMFFGIETVAIIQTKFFSNDLLSLALTVQGR